MMASAYGDDLRRRKSQRLMAVCHAAPHQCGSRWARRRRSPSCGPGATTGEAAPSPGVATSARSGSRRSAR